MRLKRPPPPQATFAYREPPISGNVLNGLGETQPRRPRYVFHSNSKTGPLPWDRMQALFRYSYPASMLPRMIRNMWAAFRSQGRLAPIRRDVPGHGHGIVPFRQTIAAVVQRRSAIEDQVDLNRVRPVAQGIPSN